MPPFFMQDATGQLTGYDIALARDIAKHLGVKIIFNREATTVDDLIDQVATGQADIAISFLSRTLHRAMKVNFTEPYLQVKKTLLVNRLQIAQLDWENRVPQMLR